MFPRLPNLDIVYIAISSLPRLPYTAPIVFGKDGITTSYYQLLLHKLNIHSIKQFLSVVVYLTFDDYHRTVMMICLRDDILLRLTDYNDDLMCHFFRF